MKHTDLEKHKGKKLMGKLTQAGGGATFGQDATVAALSRRDQRKLDQELGLVPFAVKLPSDLVAQLHARVQVCGTGINKVVQDLLTQALADQPKQ